MIHRYLCRGSWQGVLGILALGLFVLVVIWTMGEPIRHWGTAAINYDDSEYVYHAIDTSDRLDQQGLLAWPGIVYQNQHYGKPPLFVNVMSASMQMVGRETPLRAIRWGLMVSVGVLLGVIVWVFARTYGTVGGWFGTFAVISLPAFATWAPRVYPDILVAICALAALVPLATYPPQVLARGRAGLLGLAWGFGMYAKTTYPLYVIGPLLLWLLSGRTTGQWMARAKSLVPALCVAAAMCSVWYGRNAYEAMRYVQGAIEFVYDPDLSRLENFGLWVQSLMIDGMGWLWITILMVSIGGSIKKARKPQEARLHKGSFLPRMLFSSAFPMFLLALFSRAPANTRHPLPSLMLLALGATAIALNSCQQSPRGRLIRNVWLMALVVQSIVFLVTIFGVANRRDIDAIFRISRTLAPGFETPQFVDEMLVYKAYKTIVSHPEYRASVVYLAGHDGNFHVPKLNLFARLDDNPIRFDYTTYFSWSEDAVRKTLTERIGNGETILLLHDKNQDMNGASRYFNRHYAEAVRQLDGVVGHGYTTEVLVDNQERTLKLFVSDRMVNKTKHASKEVRAVFENKLSIVSVATTGDFVLVRLQALSNIDKDYKMMVRIGDEPNRVDHFVLDQYITPGISTWRRGTYGDVVFRLPPEFRSKNVCFKLGFFDEADSKHGWPRLRMADAQDAVSFCIP